MKRAAFALAIALGLAAVGTARAVPTRQLSEQARAAAARGEWNTAARSFEELVAAGDDSSDVLFDLGTVYAHAGRYGEAIWRLEQVARRSPFAADAQQNLRASRLLLAHRDAARSGSAIVETATPLGTWLAELLPIDWAVALTLALELGALACGYVWLRRRRTSESAAVASAAGALSLAAVAAFTAAIVVAAAVAPRDAIVLRDGLHLLREPTADAIGDAAVREGERVERVASRGAFLRVHTVAGATGWLLARDLGPLAE